MIPVKKHPLGLVVQIFVQPRASRNAVIGMHGDALKIKLTAPPVDDAANIKCVDFLASCLKISKSSIEIISGRSSRKKQLLLRFRDGVEPKDERERLISLLASLLPSSINKPKKIP